MTLRAIGREAVLNLWTRAAAPLAQLAVFILAVVGDTGLLASRLTDIADRHANIVDHGGATAIATSAASVDANGRTASLASLVRRRCEPREWSDSRPFPTCHFNSYRQARRSGRSYPSQRATRTSRGSR
ncbi:MAG TPA: hypothetical protein PLV68_02695 [Ilumatobacteraceae bacterium]|nr:hypothetical protein [Ilumatobacteraceae bacterium]